MAALMSISHAERLPQADQRYHALAVNLYPINYQTSKLTQFMASIISHLRLPFFELETGICRKCLMRFIPISD